jgi:hypothetical protein
MKSFRRFLIFMFVLIGGGYILYSYHPASREKMDRAWGYLFATDSTQTGDAPGLPLKGKVVKGLDSKQQMKERFAKMDAHAAKVPEDKCKDVPTLAKALVAPAKTEMEKVRAIFRWLTLNIRYDDDSYNSGQYGATDAEGTLQSRTSVCQGFAELMKGLCNEAGLEAEVVSGYSKGYSFFPGKHYTETDHAWNAVKVDGQWRLFDATWAEGNGTTKGGKLVSVRGFDPFWFDVDPYSMLFSHLPEDPQWQLIPTAISLAEYEQMPYVQANFFAAGFDGKTAFEKVRRGELSAFPETYSLPSGMHAKVSGLPYQKRIQPGQRLHVEVRGQGFVQAALINADEWVFMKEKNGVFTADLTVQKGRLSLAFSKEKGQSGNYSNLLAYEVKPAPFKPAKKPA